MTPDLPRILVKGGSDELVRLFQQYEAAFLVVGGTAVAMYGCRNPYEVDDFDILIEPTVPNAGKVIAALRAGFVAIPFAAEALARPAVQVPLKVWHYWADVLTPEADTEFAGLLSRATPAQIGHLTVPVIGRADLITMKERAVARDDTNRAKHERDLQCLKAEA